MDPHAENYLHASPFSYVENNPISRIDPDGRDWYEYNGNYQWRRSQDKSYTDDDGNEWSNVGTSAAFFHGNTLTIFQQHTNDNGELSLSSSSFNFDNKGSESSFKDFVLGMQNSDKSREAAQKYWDEPSLKNWVSYVGTEVASQWTNPELVVGGLTVLVGGMSAMTRTNLMRAANSQSKSGLTEVGRSLQKHGDRAGSLYPNARGNPSTVNVQANKILTDIISNPSKTVTFRHHARFGNIMEIKTPSGQGARFSADGNRFLGFVE